MDRLRLLIVVVARCCCCHLRSAWPAVARFVWMFCPHLAFASAQLPWLNSIESGFKKDERNKFLKIIVERSICASQTRHKCRIAGPRKRCASNSGWFRVAAPGQTSASVAVEPTFAVLLLLPSSQKFAQVRSSSLKFAQVRPSSLWFAVVRCGSRDAADAHKALTARPPVSGRRSSRPARLLRLIGVGSRPRLRARGGQATSSRAPGDPFGGRLFSIALVWRKHPRKRSSKRTLRAEARQISPAGVPGEL